MSALPGRCGWPDGYEAIAEWDKYSPAPGCDWSGDAGAWVENAKTKNWVTYTDMRAAEPGAIIVWKNGNMGHCGVVTSVSGSGISVKEMNWGKQVPGAEAGWPDMAGRYGTHTLRFSDNLSTASYKFAGFIMPRKTTAYSLNVVLNIQAVADMQSLRGGNGNLGAIVPNSLSVDRNWSPDYELRSSPFNYWLGRVTVYHATWKLDPKVRFTTYYEPFTKQWIGWTQVR